MDGRFTWQHLDFTSMFSRLKQNKNKQQHYQTITSFKSKVRPRSMYISQSDDKINRKQNQPRAVTASTRMRNTKNNFRMARCNTENPPENGWDRKSIRYMAISENCLKKVVIAQNKMEAAGNKQCKLRVNLLQLCLPRTNPEQNQYRTKVLKTGKKQKKLSNIVKNHNNYLLSRVQGVKIF